MTKQLLTALMLGAGIFGIGQDALATSMNPLDDGGWTLVAHMSSTGGMFDGDGDLRSNYSYGAFVSSPSAATPDFQRAFPIVPDEIMFIAGDKSIWGIATYKSFRNLVDSQSVEFLPNLAFEVGVNGSIHNTIGNVLSRPGVTEDPWVSIEGDHFSAIYSQRIVWGDSDYDLGIHQKLKNSHDGMNVYVRVPEPSSVALLGAVLAILAGTRRKLRNLFQADPALHLTS